MVGEPRSGMLCVESQRVFKREQGELSGESVSSAKSTRLEDEKIYVLKFLKKEKRVGHKSTENFLGSAEGHARARADTATIPTSETRPHPSTCSSSNMATEYHTRTHDIETLEFVMRRLGYHGDQPQINEKIIINHAPW
jgi:hypothetical protein